WRVHPANPEPGCEHFRDRTQVQHATVSIVCGDGSRFGFRRHLVKTQQAVRMVFDDQDIATLRPVDYLTAFAEAEKRAGWILEVGYEIQQLDCPSRACRPLPDFIEVVETDSVVLEPDAAQFRLHVLECGDRAGEGRELDQHNISGTDEHAGDQIDSLLRATRDHQLVERGMNAPVLEDIQGGFKERLVAASWTVLQRVRLVAGEPDSADLTQLLPGKQRRVGISRCERDHVAGTRHDRAHPPNSGFGQLSAGWCKELCVSGHDALTGASGRTTVSPDPVR